MPGSPSPELDFDDPSFLVPSVSSSDQPPLTYTERRRRQAGRGRERAELEGRNRSRKQREEEGRQEGLSRNLISEERLKEAAGGGESKALKMMKGMGFTPGDSLGRKRSRSPPPPASAEPSTSAARGLGFSSSSHSDAASTPPPAQKARTEPLTFNLREKRTGLGVPQPSSTKRRPFPSHLLPSAPGSSTPQFAEEELNSYLSSVKSTLDSRKLGGYYRSLRRTCEELDRRAGMGDEGNVMWRDPEEEEREEGKKMRRSVLEGDDDDLEEIRKKRKGELGFETGQSSVVVDLDEEDGAEDAEATQWFAFDLPTRVGLLLSYLRSEYHYCFWCGCQYTSQEELSAECPGEGEADH